MSSLRTVRTSVRVVGSDVDRRDLRSRPESGRGLGGRGAWDGTHRCSWSWSSVYTRKKPPWEFGVPVVPNPGVRRRSHQGSGVKWDVRSRCVRKVSCLERSGTKFRTGTSCQGREYVGGSGTSRGRCGRRSGVRRDGESRGCDGR